MTKTRDEKKLSGVEKLQGGENLNCIEKIQRSKKPAGIQKIQCKSCRNECMLEVEVKDGKILSVKGNGCRRGLLTAERKAILDR